jgi:hypothetical protein
MIEFNIEVPDVPTKAAAYPNDRIAKDTRIIAFWAMLINAMFFRVGKFLASPYKGATLAHALLRGESIGPITSISVKGVKLPLSNPLTLSMDTIKEWGCPFCGSAHGSGVAPSKLKHKDAGRLGHSNNWYYNVNTGRMHVISDTCHMRYVKGLEIVQGKVKVAIPEIKALDLETTVFSDVPPKALAEEILARALWVAEAKAKAEAEANKAEVVAPESETPKAEEVVVPIAETPKAEAVAPEPEATPSAETVMPTPELQAEYDAIKRETDEVTKPKGRRANR